MLKTLPTAGPSAKEHKKQCKIKIIAALADDIRGDWSQNTAYRVQLMMKLCIDIEKIEWAVQLKANMDLIIEDGRWMRDYWMGPYGATSQEEIGDDVLYEKYKDCFQHPESNFEPRSPPKEEKQS